MNDKTDEMASKPVNIIFSVIGIDGKPLEGARIRVDRKGDRTATEPFTDIFTDKNGKAVTSAGGLLMACYTLTHGYYSAEGSGGIGNADRYFSISFEGFKLLSASFDCPGIPEDVPMSLSLCERVCYKTGFSFHPLVLTSYLKKNMESGMWELQMYIPTADFCWCLSGKNMFTVFGEISVQEDVLLDYSMPPCYPVMFTAENTLPERKYSVLVNDKGTGIGTYALNTEIYMPQGKFSCRLSARTNFLEFQVNGSSERQYVHLDYAVMSKLEPVSFVYRGVGKGRNLNIIHVFPVGFSWTIGNFVDCSMHNLALPVGKYNYYFETGDEVVVRGELEVKEGVENELVVDASKWQEITYQTEAEVKDMEVRLVDENFICRGFSEKSSDSFYAEPGTYTLYGTKTKPVKVVVGDAEPEKVILPLYEEGISAMCSIRDVYGHSLFDVKVMVDGEPFFLADCFGTFMAEHIIPGEHTFMVSAAGYKTYTCTVNIQKGISAGIVLLPE